MKVGFFTNLVCTPILLSLLFASSFFLLQPQTVHAQISVVKVGDTSETTFFDRIQQIGQRVSGFLTVSNTGISASNSTVTNFRESVLNPLAWFAAKAVIRGITRSVVNWIRNGFQGSPGFVTDPEAFINNVIDEAVGQYIYGTELGFLCSPFQLDIRIALAINFKRGKADIACRLSDVTGNIDNFFKGTQGSFMQSGGWQNWFQVVSADNPYNRYIEATTALEVNITNARNQQIKLLDWGRGFFSWKECQPVTESVKAGQVSERAAEATQTNSVGRKDVCTIQTPGSFIEGQLGIIASSPLRQLELADSINEIVGELALQLVSQALGGAGGLLGGGTNSYDSGYEIPSDLLLPPGTNFSTSANPNIALEENYKIAQQATLERVLLAERKLSLAPSCAAVSVAGAMATQITPLKTTLTRDIAQADTAIAYFLDLDKRLNNASSTKIAEAAAKEYGNPPASLVVHTSGHVIEAQLKRETLNSELSQLERQIEAEGVNCTAILNANNGNSSVSADN